MKRQGTISLFKSTQYGWYLDVEGAGLFGNGHRTRKAAWKEGVKDLAIHYVKLVKKIKTIKEQL